MDCKLCNKSSSFDKTCILICCLKLTAAVHLTCIYDRGQRSDIALSHSLSFSPVSTSLVKITAECKFLYVHLFNSFHVLLILSYAVDLIAMYDALLDLIGESAFTREFHLMWWSANTKLQTGNTIFSFDLVTMIFHLLNQYECFSTDL